MEWMWWTSNLQIHWKKRRSSHVKIAIIDRMHYPYTLQFGARVQIMDKVKWCAPGLSLYHAGSCVWYCSGIKLKAALDIQSFSFFFFWNSGNESKKCVYFLKNSLILYVLPRRKIKIHNLRTHVILCPLTRVCVKQVARQEKLEHLKGGPTTDLVLTSWSNPYRHAC